MVGSRLTSSSNEILEETGGGDPRNGNHKILMIAPVIAVIDARKSEFENQQVNDLLLHTHVVEDGRKDEREVSVHTSCSSTLSQASFAGFLISLPEEESSWPATS